MRLIAKKAMAMNTGARGLRALLENVLTEAMFEVHPMEGNIYGYILLFLSSIFPCPLKHLIKSGLCVYVYKYACCYFHQYDVFFIWLYGQIPDKAGVGNIKGVLVDEEAVGSVNGPGCGAKILYRDDGELEGQPRATSL